VKDQMTARNFVLVNDKGAGHSVADFLPIYTCMGGLLPVCDLIATAVAANNQAHITEVEEVLIDLIKDCVKKLQDTKTRANGILANPWLAPAQVTLDLRLLLPGTSVLWGSATVIPNTGQLAQLPLVAIIPGALQPQVPPVNLAPPPSEILAPQGNGGVSGSLLPQAFTKRPRHLSPRLNWAMTVHPEMSYLKLLSTLPWHHSSRRNRAMQVLLEMSSLYHRLTTWTIEKIKVYVLLRIITLCQPGSCKLAKAITKLET